MDSTDGCGRLSLRNGVITTRTEVCVILSEQSDEKRKQNPIFDRRTHL
jgi:hypothetical protein